MTILPSRSFGIFQLNRAGLLLSSFSPSPAVSSVIWELQKRRDIPAASSMVSVALFTAARTGRDSIGHKPGWSRCSCDPTIFRLLSDSPPCLLPTMRESVRRSCSRIFSISTRLSNEAQRQFSEVLKRFETERDGTWQGQLSRSAALVLRIDLAHVGFGMSYRDFRAMTFVLA
jgi:hypothetical protein